MSSEAVAEELPKIAPIRTTAARDQAGEGPRPEEGAAYATVTSDRKEEEEEDGCVTPKSEDHVLKPAMVCPPAPRKPRLAKRKMGRPPPQGFFAVPSDLTFVYVTVSNHPLKKRMRVG